MAESWMTPDVVCPYFSKECKKQRSITCEGPQDGTTVQMNFAREVERMRWLQRHCMMWDYETCPICKMAAEKYEER
jgi:hypothetical protein